MNNYSGSSLVRFKLPEGRLASLECPNFIVNLIDQVKQFEKPKKQISEDRENIYIIDTNIFVDYPDIISKIDK